MLDIVGNIKIDESKPERVKMLIACIRSLYFLKDSGVAFYLNLDGASPELQVKVAENLEPFKERHLSTFSGNYGEVYLKLIDKGDNPFILNFIEDHFCVLDDAEVMRELLREMYLNKCELMKASFFHVEQNSSKYLNCFRYDNYGKWYLNDLPNFRLYSHFYSSRYYIGVNFITSRKFALRFWDRPISSNRPHDWEIAGYDRSLIHSVLIPKFEVLAAIDDCHGEEGSCLFKRNEPKFQKIWSEIK